MSSVKGVIEIGHVEAGQVLREGRVVVLDLAEQLEGSDVVLAASLEGHVAEIGGVGDDGAEHVPEHSTVDLTVLNLGVSVGPGNIEDVG